MKKIIEFCLLFVAVLTLALAFPGKSEAKKQYLFFGASAATSSHYAYVVGATKAINKYVPGVKANVVETGASVDNIKRIRAG